MVTLTKNLDTDQDQDLNTETEIDLNSLDNSLSSTDNNLLENDSSYSFESSEENWHKNSQQFSLKNPVKTHNKNSGKKTLKKYNALLEGKNLFPVSVVVSLMLGLVNSLILIVLTVGFFRIAYRPIPSLVQTVDGETITVAGKESTHREPQLIKNFVGQIGSLLFSWSGRVQVTDSNGASQIIADEGVPVADGGAKVTTPVSEASAAVSMDFRTGLLSEIASLIPPGVWAGQAEVVLEYVSIGDPFELAPGDWEVPVVANLNVKDEGGSRGIPFNKKVFVRAIDTPPLPLPQEATPLQKSIYSVRSSRLEIYKIEDLEVQK